MESLANKITKVINTEVEYAEKRGHSKLSTCDHYNWDRDIWNFRHEIINEIKKLGYGVSINTKWGVTDIITTKKLTF